MGYYDERFVSDVVFAAKFFFVLVAIRYVGYYFGYVEYIPVIDDFVRVMVGFMRDFGEACGRLFGIRI